MNASLRSLAVVGSLAVAFGYGCGSSSDGGSTANGGAASSASSPASNASTASASSSSSSSKATSSSAVVSSSSSSASSASSGGGGAASATSASSSGSGGAAPLMCPAGSTLLHDRTSCPGATSPPPSSFVNATASPGDVVSMGGLDEGSLPCAPSLVCAPSNAATLLFSDDPESPSSDGVLYADTVGAGRYRVYVYHANGDTSSRKFPVVVLNQGASDAHVTITKKGLATPGTDYVAIGKSVAAAWLDSSLSDVVTVPASTRVLLDSDLDAEHAVNAELVHAIYDLETDAPLKISVVSVLASEDAAKVTAGLSLLPDDGLHNRGTFPGADVTIVTRACDDAPSSRHLRLGDGTTEDELTGKDATTGNPEKLLGNYGMLYRLDIDASSNVVLAASPRGGAWGGVASLDLSPSVLLPSMSSSLDSTTDAAWLGAYGASDVALSLVSAGGSNLPVDVVVACP